MDLQLPEHFEDFADGRKQGFLRVKAAKETGKRVAGYFCTFTPLEILDAAGMLTVSLCGMSGETIPDAEMELPKNLCPLIKSSYGFALTEKCPYTYFSDLIVGETTCDGKKKMYEQLGKMKKTYILHLPQTNQYDYALELWTNELRRFIAYLEKEFDIKITDDKLRAAAEKRNELRHAKVELMEIMKAGDPPVSGHRLYKFMDGLGFKFDLDDAISSIKGLTKEILETSSEETAMTDRKRILVTGCPIGGVLDKVVGSVENNGGVVVCYENCTGIKAAKCYVDTSKEDIVGAIAEAYLQIGCSVMTPNINRMENLKKLIKEFNVDGVIDTSLSACTSYMIETNEVKKVCEEEGVRYTYLETDYSTQDGGQINTRLEAFIEMLG